MTVLICIGVLTIIAALVMWYSGMTAEYDPEETETQTESPVPIIWDTGGNMKKYKYKIDIYEGKDGWRWRIKAGNGQIMAHSEAYYARRDATRSAQKIALSELELCE